MPNQSRLKKLRRLDKRPLKLKRRLIDCLLRPRKLKLKLSLLPSKLKTRKIELLRKLTRQRLNSRKNKPQPTQPESNTRRMLERPRSKEEIPLPSNRKLIDPRTRLT